MSDQHDPLSREARDLACLASTQFSIQQPVVPDPEARQEFAIGVRYGSAIMEFATHVTHYFEKEAGPLLNICDLDPQQRSEIIDLEKTAQTGFNRFSLGEEFFDFRLLADDLLLELYACKFGERAKRRPFYGVLGDADVVGGLYRNPYKISIPIDSFGPGELTFMCPDHFHLVSFMKRSGGKRAFGFQPPKDYTESKYPYFGKLMTYEELVEGFHELKIDQHLESERKKNGWYRYVEAQIWSEPEAIRRTHGISHEVIPEPWTHNGVTHLQNYKTMQSGPPSSVSGRQDG